MEVQINGKGMEMIGSNEAKEINAIDFLIDPDDIADDVSFIWYCQRDGELLAPIDIPIIVLPGSEGKLFFI